MMKTLLLALVACAALLAQNARMDGTVTDPTGAAVPGAEVMVTNVATGQAFKTMTGDRGDWAIAGVSAATYRVSVSRAGFKVATLDSVEVNAGVPRSVNMKLEVGQANETITVSGGAELVQATSAEVSSTVTGRQIFELPFATRNALELLVTQPGTQTPTTPRSSSINGLPKGALNVTIDGMNTQDNLLKSSDGFFSYIMPSVDALEEVTLTTSAGGVDATSQGAAQIKFVTKSGTNQFHGGAFYQVRNTAFDSNYYFNNRDGLPRDVIHLSQRGGHLGGPFKKDKAFFFVNYEQYRLPGTKAYSRTVLTDDARNGIFTYQDSATKQLRSVNLYSLVNQANASRPASVRAYATTPDPILQATYDQIAKLSSGGSLKSNATSSNFYTNTLNYQPDGNDKRDFWTARLDYNLTQSHHLSFTYNYDAYNSIPDFLNNVVAVYPGTGTVLGSDVNTGQRSNRFAGVLSLRSSISSHLTNEWRGGLNGGTVLFFDAIGGPGLFAQWKGYSPSATAMAVTTRSSSSRRNSPVKDLADTVSYFRGAHQITFGGNFSQVNLYQQSIGTALIPGISMGISSIDPIHTGASDIFTTANLPGAVTGDLNNAASLYASLTGRVSSISRNLVLDETSHKYGNVAAIDRDQIREYGLFVQDSWRLRPNLTVSAGLRMEKQLPFVNTNKTYSRVGIDSIWGVSGVGNLFKPGTLTGVVPTYLPLTDKDQYNPPIVWAPSVGLAWQVPAQDWGPLAWIFGRRQGASVLRGGYSIATVREGSNTILSLYAANQGLNQDASLSPTTFPADFGPAGSVYFRDSSFPGRSGLQSAPNYPIPVNFTNSLNEFDPGLKMGYVQSWNIGWQRELGRNTVMEIRYTGNHGVHEWRQINLNEVNTVENGFLNEFATALKNLTIARQTNPTTTNWGNQGLAGQGNVPIIQTAFGNTTDSNTAQSLINGAAGTVAGNISGNQARMTNLTASTSKACNGAPCPANIFVVNPTVAGSGTYLMTNGGSSFYDALQVEFRRRLSAGFTIQGSYAWSKSLANGAVADSADFSGYTTMRNTRLDRVPSGFDIRHGLKANWIYEFPFGPGKKFLSGGNAVARKALEGWEMAGVMRLQSGTPYFLSSFATFNTAGGGIVLHNMTSQQLQDMVQIRKTTDPVTHLGVVYYLPQNVIDNTMAAFQQGTKTLKDLDATQPYIGPAALGTMAWKGYFYWPWQQHYDVSLVKITRLKERQNIEFRAQALNVFNVTNFLPGSNVGSAFGQVGSAYRDISGTVDPGGRILEFVLRVNF
jgi:hypothetical protein